MKFVSVAYVTLYSIANISCNHTAEQNNPNSVANRPNIDSLLDSPDINKSIIELDNYISELCAYGENIEVLNGPQKIFYLNQQIEREVNNGGFNQYFFNSSGDFAHETIASLKHIDANITAAILKEAIAQFPNDKVPKNESERRKVLSEIEQNANPVWHKLDEKFYKYEEDLNALNLKYLTKHKDSL